VLSGIGLAGVRDENDRETVRETVRKVWGNMPVFVTHDLQIALAAAATPATAQARVLVLSGTGSCCYGENIKGETAKVGGWGHLLGDLGSGYDIALRALKGAIYDYDRAGKWGALGGNLLRALLLNTPNDLIAWAQSSDKAAIARLAPIVFESKDDPVARRILSEVSEQLASDAVTCAFRVARRDKPVAFVMAGSVLRQQPAFARRIGRLIRRRWLGASIHIASEDGALGAAKLAVQLCRSEVTRTQISRTPSRKPFTSYAPSFDPSQSPTEQRNPKSLKLDKLRSPPPSI
jgi:N-acetylglucosamine kinase-like BadF-type ATPase